ncbi:hypothetical protein PIB30_054189 [Stylosanthes scabra]|uniref:Uncharacterized protein n=1 Tax=Stylosanthes scabra TaxID=79078 RepID=A0ABU6YG49_9FABA|nr:hypothetical protein [Stylosanthes scabra]
MIGDMISLESLDFSHNKFFGAIPSSMSNLTFLSHLNLSNNNFSGPIPRDCPDDDSHDPHGGDYEDEAGENDKSDEIWFYFVISLGFVTGFWGVIGVLYLKKNWRHDSFGYMDEVAERIYVVVVLKVAKLKNRLQ